MPAVVIMTIIFLISAQPSDSLPDFDWADRIIKKGGHMLGFGTLALAFWYAFEWAERKRWLAWFLAFIYAMTDEFHQSFVPGRHPSAWDVLIFDNLGALISLWMADKHFKQK